MPACRLSTVEVQRFLQWLEAELFGARVVDFGGGDAVDVADKLWRQDFRWVAFGVQVSVFEDDGVVAVSCN